ncbi:MAG TPA: F0F1 ATP synthase subunit delta [Candidatus Dormibacteraeota bacterium]|nr:F0F1 ATP synthase subunit delta [Candidatus Dormibacteraeota bacterium]
MPGRPSTAARRYAEAVFELARRDDTEDAWHYALRAAAEAVGRPEVLRIVENPARPHEERLAVVREVLAADSVVALVRAALERDRPVLERLGGVLSLVRGRVSDRLVNLVGLLVDRRGVRLLPAIADEYDRLLDAQRGILRATVTSATELSGSETTGVREKLEAMTGSRVELARQVDPTLIGGLTIRVGDRLVDASVRGRLERLRDQLMAAGTSRSAGPGAEAH